MQCRARNGCVTRTLRGCRGEAESLGWTRLHVHGRRHIGVIASGCRDISGGQTLSMARLAMEALRAMAVILQSEACLQRRTRRHSRTHIIAIEHFTACGTMQGQRTKGLDDGSGYTTAGCVWESSVWLNLTVWQSIPGHGLLRIALLLAFRFAAPCEVQRRTNTPDSTLHVTAPNDASSIQSSIT